VSDPAELLLHALAERYAGTEFTARAAAGDLSPALWAAVGIASPDPAAVGRWLRVRKGAVAGFALGNRKNRDGVALWRVRPVEARQAAPAIPRDPAPAEASPAPPRSGSRPKNPPFAAPRAPWWAVPAPPPQSTPGGAAERDGGASWWTDLGEVTP
jgi:hypothetical protein